MPHFTLLAPGIWSSRRLCYCSAWSWQKYIMESASVLTWLKNHVHEIVSAVLLFLIIIITSSDVSYFIFTLNE